MDGRKRVRIGQRYRVHDFCGLDSGRVGVAVRQDASIVRKTEGWYGDVQFKGRMAVVLLQDERGYFAPFRAHIEEV